MALQIFYWMLFVASLASLFFQLTVRHKKTLHLVFAILCGSMAMVALQKIVGNDVGAYRYLLGLGTCATCNGYWLVSRALFRNEKPISSIHILVALSIALLVASDQSLMFVKEITAAPQQAFGSINIVLGELMNLLSSCILMLSFWEGCRGWRSANRTDKLQRVVFICSYGTAVGICVVGIQLFSPFMDSTILREWFVTGAALLIILTTQLLILWRHPDKISIDTTLVAQKQANVRVDTQTITHSHCESDLVLAQQISTQLSDKKIFLQANLKVVDLARELNVSEYRISQILRSQFQAQNFNHFINTLRIKHAKTLLRDPDKNHWPVLVVGLESGFASVGPFTRAFKANTGKTPGQYRQNPKEADYQLGIERQGDHYA